MGHHAGAYALDFRGVTSGPAAGLLGYAQIAGVYKLDVIHLFFQPVGVGAHRVGGGSGALCKSRPRVSLFGHFEVLLRSLSLGYPGRQCDLGISSMTVGAAQTDGAGGVHGRTVHRVVATYTTGRPLLRLLERVAKPGETLFRARLRRHFGGLFRGRRSAGGAKHRQRCADQGRHA